MINFLSSENRKKNNLRDRIRGRKISYNRNISVSKDPQLRYTQRQILSHTKNCKNLSNQRQEERCLQQQHIPKSLQQQIKKITLPKKDTKGLGNKSSNKNITNINKNSNNKFLRPTPVLGLNRQASAKKLQKFKRGGTKQKPKTKIIQKNKEIMTPELSKQLLKVFEQSRKIAKNWVYPIAEEILENRICIPKIPQKMKKAKSNKKKISKKKLMLKIQGAYEQNIFQQQIEQPYAPIVLDQIQQLIIKQSIKEYIMEQYGSLKKCPNRILLVEYKSQCNYYEYLKKNNQIQFSNSKLKDRTYKKLVQLALSVSQISRKQISLRHCLVNIDFTVYV